MKRRNFLRTLGISALAVPVAIEAVKGVEVSKEKNLIEQAGKYEKEYTHNWIRIQDCIAKANTINLIAPVKPSGAGEAIYIYTDNDNVRVHDYIHIPSIYFDDKSASDLPQIYRIVGTNTLKIIDTYIVCEYKCLPFQKDLALTKEIPVEQKLIFTSIKFKPGMGEPI